MTVFINAHIETTKIDNGNQRQSLSGPTQHGFLCPRPASVSILRLINSRMHEVKNGNLCSLYCILIVIGDDLLDRIYISKKHTWASSAACA